MDDSLRRRFDFSLSFQPFDRRERVRVWQHVLESSPVKSQVSGNFVEKASEHFIVNAAGIFIATTNFLQTLDPASMRRFSWKVEFRPLNPEGKKRLYSMFFPDRALESADELKLCAISPLTPGDFRAVEIRLDGRCGLDAPEILSELASEVRYKEENRSRPMGFRSG